MLKSIALAIALLCVFTIPSDAGPRHKSTGLHPECNVTMPCVTPSASTPEQSRWDRGMYLRRQIGFGGPHSVKRPTATKKPNLQGKFAGSIGAAVPSYGVPSPSVGYAIAKPLRFIAGRLICAINVGAALAERGIKGTGSALAMSYRTWGKSAGGPVPGAVIVSSRRGGGHVAIVSRVQNGVVYAWNATGGQRGWREIPYRHHVIDYRVPG